MLNFVVCCRTIPTPLFSETTWSCCHFCYYRETSKIVKNPAENGIYNGMSEQPFILAARIPTVYILPSCSSRRRLSLSLSSPPKQT